MFDLIVDTSPMQYLHQLELLQILPNLAKQIFVPSAVLEEIKIGHSLGVDLPKLEELDWVNVRQPASVQALPLITNLGPGETEVLMLGLEMRAAAVVLDDGPARDLAEILDLRLTGSLGLLLDAKKAGFVMEIRPLLEKLQSLRLRLASRTFAAVLRLAGEAE